MSDKIKSKLDKIDDIKLIWEAILVGLFAGLIVILYRYLLHKVEDLLPILRNILLENKLYIVIFFILIIAMSIIVGLLRNWEKFSGGSGIPQVEAEIKGYINQNPIKILLAKILGGLGCAFGGLSLGREGPSIQIGAMSGKLVSKILSRNKTTERFLLSCGASAGLAAAFNAPVAGVMFAIEEIHKHVSKKLLITTLTSTVIADYTAKLFYGKDTIFSLNINNIHIPFNKYWWIALLGIILSIIAVIYTNLMKLFNNMYDKLALPIYFRPIIPFILGAILLFICPQVIGGGNYLIDFIIKQKPTLFVLLLFFIVKLIFSMLSFTSGVAGGIFFPILVLGASLGSIFGKILAPDMIDLFIILSMAGLLTAIVRAPLTAIILIFEMTGNLTYLLPLSLVCLIAYAFTNYISLVPIYEYLLENLLKKNEIIKQNTSKKILINAVVQPGSFIDNKKISEIKWPSNCLIVSIDRGVDEVLPKGSTKLRSGDNLEILLNENEFINDYDLITRLCLTEKELLDDI